MIAPRAIFTFCPSLQVAVIHNSVQSALFTALIKAFGALDFRPPFAPDGSLGAQDRARLPMTERPPLSSAEGFAAHRFSYARASGPEREPLAALATAALYALPGMYWQKYECTSCSSLASPLQLGRPARCGRKLNRDTGPGSLEVRSAIRA